MNSKQFTRSAVKWLGAAVGLATATYATYVGVTWLRYGKAVNRRGEASDDLMDRFMPSYEVGDRHKIRVAAPAELTLSAASEMDLEGCGIARAIFKGREWILNSKKETAPQPRGLLEQTKALGWGVLAEVPGREIVMGAVTKPWEANPVFRALLPDEFAAFQEPGYVKIAWTLRADPMENGESVFRTETRAIATDPAARKRFRRYWAFLSPGIIAIRFAMLPVVKADAQRRAREVPA